MAARKKTVSHGAAEVAAEAKAKVKRKAPAKQKQVKARPSRQEVMSALLLRPLTPSPVLAKVVGKRPRSRIDFVKALWRYVKKHGLLSGRNIRADDKLRPLFGGREEVSMFELTKHLNANLA